MMQLMQTKPASRQVNVRVDNDLERVLDDLRRRAKPIPTEPELFRRALRQMWEREVGNVSGRRKTD